MKYSRLQRYLSALLIFSILFLQTVEVPLFNSARAEAKKNTDLISFIVDDAIYSGDIESRITQYAKDVQAYLPNTRVVIFPVSRVINPFNIASLNERLYYEGDGGGLSRIIGTVLIGEVPLPVVHSKGKAFLSVYPYVDFDNKSFIYDQTKKDYEYTKQTVTDEKPEIWHSVIRPNTGDGEKDKEKLIAFFDKTHDFYLKQGVFSPENTLSEPRVFYFDAYHDQKTASAKNWGAYNLLLQHIEDITYNRFSKYLAKTIYDATQESSSDSSETPTDPDIQALLASSSGSTMDFSATPDISTKTVIEKATKKFFEVFNEKYMGDILRYIHNTGRYGEVNNLRGDPVPAVIAKKDRFMGQTLKDTNTVMESAIDILVKKSLSRNIPILTDYTITIQEKAPETHGTYTYKNYFFGNKAEQVSFTGAAQCTIVRGSSLKVESNRGYDLQNIEADIDLLKGESATRCLPDGNAQTFSYWGGNSPLNFDSAGMAEGAIKLKGNVYKDFIKPIYDAAGSRELEIASPLHIGTPLDCLENNILFQKTFDCTTVHERLATPINDFTSYYKGFPSESCTQQHLILDGTEIKNSNEQCPEYLNDVLGVSYFNRYYTNYIKTFSFKKIPSYIEHKSPTDEEYGAELKGLVTPSLPSDKDRYIDFISAKGNYAKIAYPNFFRIELDEDTLNYEGAKVAIKKLLDEKSAEINTLVTHENPNGLSGKDKEIATVLSVGQYLTANVDLYNIIASDEKALNALIESVIWHNMNNATLKYSSILEQNLDIDGMKKISADGRKNDYEIAYLGAPGDAKNMYVAIDPAAKGPLDASISDIMNKMNEYRGLIDGSNIASGNGDSAPSESDTKCGPPEGVSLDKWLPAIFCWIGTILPPTITAGSCTNSVFSTNGASNDTSSFNDASYKDDADKNGIVDGDEIIASGNLVLKDPLQTFNYNETIPLEANLMKGGKIITIDNFNVVNFGIKKLEVYSGSANTGIKKVVYDRESGDETLSHTGNIIPYISFKPMGIRAKNGVASYSFTTKNSDMEVTLDAHILTKDRYGAVVTDKTAPPVIISVRSERISVRSQVSIGGTFSDATVIEAGNPQGLRFILKKVDKNQIASESSLPYTLKIYDDIDNTLLSGPINVGASQYDYTSVNKSGVYRFEFIDHKGIKGTKTITILPAAPSKIEAIPASNIFVAGQKTTVLIKILDALGNVAKGTSYTLSASISGGANFLDGEGKELGINTSKTVIEGYTSFDITNTQVSDSMNLTFRIDSANVASEPLTLQSIDFAKISVDVENKDSIVVGKEKHRLKISIMDRDGKILNSENRPHGGFNGIASIDFPKLSGTVEPSFVKIVNGVSTEDIFLTPKYVARENATINVQAPGITITEGNSVTVLPDIPMSFEFTKGADRMEAKKGNTTSVGATLYDRYGNVAYNASGYSIALDIPENFRKYGTLSSQTANFSAGTLDFTVAMTSLPGKFYIVGTVAPGLESNSFTVTDTSNKSVTVKGISQNIAAIDTYYLFNKEKIDKIRYDALYNILLGGNYGDVTQSDYLGGEILFNPNSKSLAVTTLLNNPWKTQELFGFTPAGKYSLIKENDDLGSLTAEISNDTNRSYITFYDSYRKENIARAWLNIDPNSTEYVPCHGSGSNISDCELSDKTTIVLKGFDGNVSSFENDMLFLKTPNKTPLVSISKNGKIEASSGIEFSLDSEMVSNLLGIKILSNGVNIGYIGIKFVNNSIEVASSATLSVSLQNHPNTIVFETLSNRYGNNKTYLGNSSRGALGIMFSFKDEGNEDIGKPDTAYVGRSAISGFEEYFSKTGVGWEDTNRTFLEVAAGTTIGDATKFYQTFSTINLGDPVSHLPKIIPSTNNFDKSIGKQIFMGADDPIEFYKKIDANGDGISDMVIFYESGKIQLLMNYQGSFKDMGYLAFVSDAGKGRKGVGDFFHDGFHDIIITDKNGQLVLLDNVQGKFTRKAPIIIDESGNKTYLSGQIQQLEIFDMDHDGYTDIVTVDDSGEINILYGGTRVVSDTNVEHIFTKKLIEPSIGIQLSPDVRNDGGAFTYEGLAYPEEPTINTDDASGSVNQGLINNIIYYRINPTPAGATPGSGTPSGYTADIAQMVADTTKLAGPGGINTSALTTSTAPAQVVFIRSPFAEGKGLTVEKRYTLAKTGGQTLRANDTVQVDITLTNISQDTFSRPIYLDSNDRSLFTAQSEGEYMLLRNGTSQTLPLKYDANGDFDYTFSLADIAPGKSIKIQYQLKIAAVSFGKITVGLLEKGESGDDVYGDIALSPNNACGENLIMWRSTAVRRYEKGTKKFDTVAELPDEFKKNAVDANKNGVPDYIDDLMNGGTDANSPIAKYASDALSDYNKDSNSNGIPDKDDTKGDSVVTYDPNTGNVDIGGLSSSNIDAINGNIDEVMKGLGCGFGGGSCIASPLNWAPLAPGSAITAFGMPVGPLSTSTGIPIFSAPTSCGPIIIWPPCPAGAGGIFGPGSSMFRLFITPTITGAVGMAMCFGNSTAMGNLPPMGVSPVIPGGNCIVAAKPFAGCAGDGSDGGGDGSPIATGLGMNSDSENSSVNANSCRPAGKNTTMSSATRDNLLKYIGGDTSVLPEVNASMSQGGLSSISMGPLVSIGGGGVGGAASDFEVSIDTAALTNFDPGSIVKIKNSRVSAFPDFLMDWVNRQIEEIVNKLTSLPTLYIILPDLSGGFDTGSGVVQNGKNISGLKTAYEFISHLPFIKLDTQMLDIDIPWMSKEDANKWLTNANLTIDQWKAEIQDKKDKWSKLTTLSGADEKVILQTEGLIGSLQENISIVEGYQKYPEKLQKYLAFKERYLGQILCNIEAIENIIGGWIGDNGRRFHAWVELYILIKAILKSWQLLIDIFVGYEEECEVCRSERWDLKQFIFKLISAIIPKIPIFTIPKWPDIWLDLHNIRAGLHILMPEFRFNFVPIVLPELPHLYLPDVPTLTLIFPTLPLLPKLPDLPDLPDLPSLPTIKLPDLPPPPTIPKLPTSISAVLTIFKLIAKILCIMKTNPFVPEWRAGDQIAQITERSGKLPIDFLMVEFPNFTSGGGFIDSIKVTTYVNLEFEVDFILEMAKATLSPLNTFTNNLSNIFGPIQIQDVNLQDTVPKNVTVPLGYNPIKILPSREQVLLPLMRKFSFDLLRSFIELNTYLHEHSKETVGLQEMKDIFKENIAAIRSMNDKKALIVADTLEKAVSYNGDTETAFIRDLQNQNKERFGLLKEYVQGEKVETTGLKTQIDTMLRTGKMDEKIPSLFPSRQENMKINFITTDTASREDLKKKILASNDRILPSLKRITSNTPDMENREIQRTGQKLLTEIRTGLDSFSRDMKRNADIHPTDYARSFDKLLALNGSTTSDSSSSSTSDSSSSLSSSYQYEGIYILDKNGKQTHLFSYADGVDGTEELVHIDVDKDGDDDIIYRMGNSLYLKENFKSEPNHDHNTGNPETKSWSDFLGTGTYFGAAPNHFEESFVGNNEINFSFIPADSEQDGLFRLEYYDYIDRFDRINSGDDKSSITPKTSLHKVDLITDLSDETTADTATEGFVGRKNIVSFGRGSGEAMMKMKKYSLITPETNGVNPIIIGKGRTVYTDAGGAVITYQSEGSTENKTLTFPENTNYEFLGNATIWVTDGNLYLFSESSEEKVVNVVDLGGIPVLPETTVELSTPASYLLFNYYDGSRMRLDGSGTYKYTALGKKSAEYTVILSAANDWYYSQLYSFSKNTRSTLASLNLLSPQIAADSEGPLITYGEAIRIPVYQERTINFQSSVQDISGVSSIYIDGDLIKDTDGDGDVKNDKDSLDPNTSFGIKKGNSVYDIDIGPFDSLFTKKIRLFAVDGNNNTIWKDLKLTVYAPTPKITSASESVVSGVLDEGLIGEPTDIFRFRNGQMVRIEPANPDSIKTLTGGIFEIGTKDGGAGVTLQKSGKKIASINERTGKISLDNATDFSISVVPATGIYPMKIEIVDSNGKAIFSERMNLSSDMNIEKASQNETITKYGAFIIPVATGISFVKNTPVTLDLPNGGYITTDDHRAIAGMSKTGDIYILDTNYTLSYSSSGSYVMIQVVNPSKDVVASVLYRMDAEYVIR